MKTTCMLLIFLALAGLVDAQCDPESTPLPFHVVQSRGSDGAELSGQRQHANDSLSLPVRNRQIIDTATIYGRQISPTYHSAVCTEYVIGVLSHFVALTPQDKSNIRIIVKEDVYGLIDNGSPQPKGVYHALTTNGMGVPVDDWNEVLPGDFVQFWYPHSWGHCGIVHSIDVKERYMSLYSSMPSTDGYGIQEFAIPDYCFFVRLR